MKFRILGSIFILAVVFVLYVVVSAVRNSSAEPTTVEEVQQ